MRRHTRDEMKDGENETDGGRNNEIDGPREVMTAACPHSLMDDKCSVSMSVSVPAARLCQCSASSTQSLAFGFN